MIPAMIVAASTVAVVAVAVVIVVALIALIYIVPRGGRRRRQAKPRIGWSSLPVIVGRPPRSLLVLHTIAPSR
jgi:hypothetical protein